MKANRGVHLRASGMSGVFAGCMGLVLATSFTGALHAQSGEDFFKGTPQLTMYVGSGAGGGYDQIARLVARHMSRYLPGNPNIIVTNMPTAGGVQAANLVYNSSPKDGSVILAATNLSMMLPVYDSPVAKYDPRKFEWIGSSGKQQGLCVTWKTSPIKTIEDAKKREVTVSASAMTNNGGVYPEVMNTLFNTKFKIIAGYSTGNMELAVERGEVEGMCGYAYQSYEAIGSNWFRNKDVNVIVQTGLEKSPFLPNVPLARDLLTNADDKAVLDLFVLPQEFGRPFIAPPGVPADRMAIYRRAFEQVMNDPAFLEDAKKQRIIIEPLTDQEVTGLLDRMYSAPKNIHDRAAVFASQLK
jgi:tripartite-type tricarboxylate transporter receptor subunit TctC